MRTSVVIPALDAREVLADQLEALSCQTLPPDEVIVADNGSAVSPVDVVESARRSGLPVRLLDASLRRGPGAARNLGATVANGEVIAFCDADDIVTPRWLETHVRALNDHGVSGGPLTFFEGNPHDLAKMTPRGGTAQTFLGRFPYTPCSNMAVRATAFWSIGGFDENLATAEDVDLCLRLTAAGHVMGWAPGARVYVRRRSDLRDAARQFFRYGRNDVAVYRRHRDGPLGRQKPWEQVRPWLVVMATLPRLLTSKRRSWVQHAALHVGRVRGSIELRTVLL